MHYMDDGQGITQEAAVKAPALKNTQEGLSTRKVKKHGGKIEGSKLELERKIRKNKGET